MSRPTSSLQSVDVLFARQIDLAGSLAPLGRAGDDLLDRWDSHSLTRTLRLPPDYRPVPYAAYVDAPTADRLSIRLPAHVDALAARHAIGASLLTDDRPLIDLARRDPAVQVLVDRHPGVVPVLYLDPFAALDPLDQRAAGQPALGGDDPGAWLASATAGGSRSDGAEVYASKPAALAVATDRRAARAAADEREGARSRRDCARRTGRGARTRRSSSALDDDELISPPDAAARHRPLERRVVPGAHPRPAARRRRRPGRPQGRRTAVCVRACRSEPRCAG